MSGSELQNNGNLNSAYLLTFFYKWRKVLLITCSLAAIVSAIVVWMIPPKYKSTVVLFPATTTSISKSLMTQNTPLQSDLLRFGEEEDMERMLQILNSGEIRDRIISKYNLADHYRINNDSKYRNSELRKEYENNIQFKKTEFMSVKIEVLDSDPQVAANMANDIASLFDSTMTRIKRDRSISAYKILKNEYENLNLEIKKSEDSLYKLMQLGVNDYESQAERLNEALGNAIVEGKTSAAAQLEQRIKTLSTYGTSYISLRDNLNHMRERQSTIREKYEESRVDIEQQLPEKFVVDNAFPAERKSYPICWVIIAMSTFATFIITILSILVIENIQHIKHSHNLA